MAAQRLLKDWTVSEKMNSLSPQAEVFFTRLIMKADDFGKFYGNPKMLKSFLYPIRDNVRVTDITHWTAECAKAGVILKYSVEGKEYVKIIDFGQRLRTMNSNFPDPQEVISNADNPPQSAAIRRNMRPEEEVEVEIEEEVEGQPAQSANAPSQDDIAFKNFQDWLSRYASNVAKMAEPFTKEQFLKLKEKHTSQEITNMCLNMHNWKDLNKKRTSAYLTYVNWNNRESR